MAHRGDRHQWTLPLLASVLGIALYGLAVLWSNRHPSWLTLMLAALPFAWLALVYARGAAQSDKSTAARLFRFVPLVLLTLCLSFAWTPLNNNVRWLYYIQHAGIHCALCWIFARTLGSGKTPLCTEFASWVHDDMSSPKLLWYTRQVTKAWAIFFAAMALVSTALFAYSSADVWTVFSVVLGPILTAAFFLAENLLRRHFLPPQDRVGLAGTWRAIQAKIQDPRSTPVAPRRP